MMPVPMLLMGMTVSKCPLRMMMGGDPVSECPCSTDDAGNDDAAADGNARFQITVLNDR